MNREQRRVVVLIWFVSSVASLEIDTLDGGYKNLLVSISEAVPYDESIIEDIKALFRSSSEFLHRATNGRVYFKQVTIEIPKAWPRRENARNVSLSSFEQSDIRIDLPSEPYGDRPFTQQLRPCGQPGDFIQLTPRFLAQLRNSTGNHPLNMAYIFVHQWAHFRYGVFDEHGCHGDNQYPLTYCHSGKVKLNACSARIGFAARTATGGKCSVDKVCRLSEDCVVSLQHSSSGHPIESSIMFMPRVGNVSHFCDDAGGGLQHNPFAPNKQNRLCQQRSTWEVISGNADFRKLPKPDISKRIEISFVVTQETNVTQRILLVLDVSSSMQKNRRLEFLKEAITRYVNGIANDSRRLAILTSSKSPNVVHPLTTVNAGTKPGFLSAINKLKIEASTCIWCGLRKAVAHLETSREATEGAIIVLVSNGEGNTGPKIMSIMPSLLKAKVVVSTLAVGATAAEILEKLASETRGKAYAFQDMQGNMALEMEAAFVDMTTSSLEQASRAQTLVNTEEFLGRLLKWPFQVDSGVGNETVVYVKVNDRHKEKILGLSWLVDPSGQRCQACTKTSIAAGIAIAIPSPAEVGTWILHLISSAKVEINIQVKSKARREGVEPIQLSCTMANMLVDRPDAAVVYAKISRGNKVALGASVFADVRGPKAGRESMLQLHDDGREPDNHAGDGTYSGYFTKFTGKGRYTVTAHVLHQNGTRLAYPMDSSACAFGIATHNTSDESTGASLDFASEHPIGDFKFVNTTAIATTDNATIIEIVDPFERAASGGSFQVTEPIFESDVPPGNIRDLAVADTRPGENGTLQVELTFTWPGAHLTSGKASSVEIRASKDYAKLKSDFRSQTKISEFNVTERGLEHAIIVSLPIILATPQQDGASTWNAYVAALATNKDGLKSTPSNVVLLDYTPPLLTTTTTTAATTTTEIITPRERATTNAAITTPEISTPTERATTKTATTTAEISPPTERATTNASTTTAEITTITERAFTNASTTTAQISTTTVRATTNASTMTAEITTPTEARRQ
ncbi:calcium-activated chloride channel regulator 1-like [Dermacentor silvarum]|uniref:calcium-activated chloride channel regulator 1-like n=1 Tax=Dermacentor silvarum TaxID=543639 RepID=UPI002101C1DC|nr:calcium-activated chloride channel regulator 1-like [Dermacentor silvarum]